MAIMFCAVHFQQDMTVQKALASQLQAYLGGWQGTKKGLGLVLVTLVLF